MGKEISKVTQKICMISSEYKVLILGLGGSGKTTLFDRLKYNEVFVRYPTIGFNSEIVDIEGKDVTLWDFGGYNKLIKLWENYFDGADLVILVIDSTDKEQFDELKNILLLLEEKLNQAYIMILLNKIDLPHTMSTSYFIQNIDLDKFNLKVSKIIRTSLTMGREMPQIKEGISNVLNSLNKNLFLIKKNI